MVKIGLMCEDAQVTMGGYIDQSDGLSKRVRGQLFQMDEPLLKGYKSSLSKRKKKKKKKNIPSRKPFLAQ